MRKEVRKAAQISWAHPPHHINSGLFHLGELQRRKNNPWLDFDPECLINYGELFQKDLNTDRNTNETRLLNKQVWPWQRDSGSRSKASCFDIWPYLFGFKKLSPQVSPNLLLIKAFEDENPIVESLVSLSNINEPFTFWKYPLFLQRNKVWIDHLSISTSTRVLDRPWIQQGNNGLTIN